MLNEVTRGWRNGEGLPRAAGQSVSPTANVDPLWMPQEAEETAARNILKSPPSGSCVAGVHASTIMAGEQMPGEELLPVLHSCDCAGERNHLLFLAHCGFTWKEKRRFLWPL